MSYITSIGTATPHHKFTQNHIADFMIRAMNLSAEEADRLKVLYRASGIESRYSVLSDYGSANNFKFYANSENLEPFPTTKERLNLFRKESVVISKSAIDSCTSAIPELDLKDITHLIVVSCTGMYAPGLDVDLQRILKLKSTVQRTSINFMGCYAAFNALRLADSFCSQDESHKVLVVCTELCSIHFQKENTDDNKLANALFADGSAAIIVESKMRKGMNLEIGSFFCDLVPDGEADMAWTIGDQGFEMKLSTYVPGLIKTGIGKLTSALLAVNRVALNDIAYFAIHPGGKKILEAIEAELELTKDDNRYAYHVLKHYGNMSSPTVVFVLHEIWKKLNSTDNDKKILSFGFGPGLTLESLILTIKNI
jgi:prepilin-type processing-associated H-X9-DG protein